MQHKGAQAALLEHILEPFTELDLITGGQDDDGWDFTEDEFSCYTYVSVLGMGHAVAFMSAFVQAVLPCVLLWATLSDVEDSVGYLPVCPASGQAVNKLTMLCVFILYFMTVVPSQISLLCVPLRSLSLSFYMTLPPRPSHPAQYEFSW